MMLPATLCFLDPIGQSMSCSHARLNEAHFERPKFSQILYLVHVQNLSGTTLSEYDFYPNS